MIQLTVRRPHLLAFTVAVCAASAATAQDTAQSATAAAAAAEEANPTDIIVTATKRAENVQDVPISISAVSADTLARQNINNLSRLDVLVPGFKFGQSGNDARPAIRGTRTQQVIGNADPLVAFYADGVYRSRPGQAVAPFTDVARVEVALGPQGTLFGRNSFGGAVNVITKGPLLASPISAVPFRQAIIRAFAARRSSTSRWARHWHCAFRVSRPIATAGSTIPAIAATTSTTRTTSSFAGS